jgi:hypothetical protein
VRRVGVVVVPLDGFEPVLPVERECLDEGCVGVEQERCVPDGATLLDEPREERAAGTRAARVGLDPHALQLTNIGSEAADGSASDHHAAARDEQEPPAWFRVVVDVVGVARVDRDVVDAADDLVEVPAECVARIGVPRIDRGDDEVVVDAVTR